MNATMSNLVLGVHFNPRLWIVGLMFQSRRYPVSSDGPGEIDVWCVTVMPLPMLSLTASWLVRAVAR